MTVAASPPIVSNPYAVDKLAAHPEALRRLRETGDGTLITVHLMPQNLCNQRCHFCSYRMPENKNSDAFDEGAHIQLPHLIELLDDLQEMGVKGVEVTGGGEPLAYPYAEGLWNGLAERGFDTALVTNGTLLRNRAALVTQRMKWARVSIDAATEETYATMRRAPRGHFRLAWAAVADLRKHQPQDPEFRLGVGFVLSNENVGDVYKFVRMARDSGADNVRLSVTFSDQHKDYFKDHAAVEDAIQASIRAKHDFEDATFKVHNLIPGRWNEVLHPAQDYRRCPTKDLLCVVEGEGKVYTCCTFTGSLSGLYGKFTEHPKGFRGLWEDHAEWRRGMDASQYCQVTCLYRDRNLAMNALIDAPTMPAMQQHKHASFI